MLSFATRAMAHRSALLLVAVAIFAMLGGAGCGKDEPTRSATPRIPLDDLPAPGSIGIDVRSPDGRWHAYELIQEDQSVDVILESSQGTRVFKNVSLLYDFSPDSAFLLYAGRVTTEDSSASASQGYGGLIRVSLSDGSVEQLTNTDLTWTPGKPPEGYVPNPSNQSITWLSDRVISYSSAYSGVYTVNIATGEVTRAGP